MQKSDSKASTRSSRREEEVSKEISKEAMDFLINEGEVMWCAGGLMVEHEKVRPFVTKIDGSEDGVMGMDKEVCARLLREVF